eukprot:Amastigsp_a344172_78.p3 type:complete len:121 gc:universal Amastigsp_a344172_78:522-160(-)
MLIRSKPLAIGAAACSTDLDTDQYTEAPSSLGSVTSRCTRTASRLVIIVGMANARRITWVLASKASTTVDAMSLPPTFVPSQSIRSSLLFRNSAYCCAVTPSKTHSARTSVSAPTWLSFL